MNMEDIKNILEKEYLINIIDISKSDESTVGNVYIIYTNNSKYVLKIYDNKKHTESITLLHTNLSSKFYIPKIIFNKDSNLYIQISSNYMVLFSFLEGIQIGKLDRIDDNIIINIAKELRKLHDETSINDYKLDEVKCDIERKSLLHFDLTKGNIFYNEGKIGFIDFDDSKYGPSIYDVAIIMCLLFFSKKKGIDKNNIKLFLDTYYEYDNDLKYKEVKYIKEIAINWINDVLANTEFNPSTKESFEVKKNLIQEYNFNNIELKLFKECINEELYNMYQDIPASEIGSTNKINGLTYEEFLNVCDEYIKEEKEINKELNTTTQRYILYDNEILVGEVGIRTTINDFWKNKGSQIYYKIRISKRGKGYGNLILSLALEKAKEIGFKEVRINCDNNNIASKKIILNNGGKEDIIDYKTNDGYSTSYIINL